MTEDLELLTMSDYYPYGMLLQGQNISTTDHRFGFQGKENDETGFVNFHWRQYDPRLGRWLSVDPYRQHHSPYLAMRNNPILFVDPDGGEDEYADQTDNEGSGYTIAELANMYGFDNITELRKYMLDQLGLEYDMNERGFFVERWAQGWDILSETRTDADGNEVHFRIYSPWAKKYDYKLTDQDFTYLLYKNTSYAFEQGYYRGMGNAIAGIGEFGWDLVTGDADVWSDVANFAEATTLPSNHPLNNEPGDIQRQRDLEQAANRLWNKVATGNITLGEAGEFVGGASASVLTAPLTSAAGARLVGVLTKGAKGRAVTGAQLSVGGCFVAGTLVWTTYGLLPIETIEVGDSVYAFNELTKRAEIAQVYSPYTLWVDTLVKVTYEGEVVWTTLEHPFYVDGEWMPAEDLLKGDIIQLHPASSQVAAANEHWNNFYTEAEIVSVEIVDTTAQVYNFGVEELANYYIEEAGLLVHNNCGANSQVTYLYRAVSKAELDDIATNGIRNKSGAYETGKLFAPTVEEAATFGRNNYFNYDKVPNTIIRVEVPNSVMSKALGFPADGMNAVSIPVDQLHLLR